MTEVSTTKRLLSLDGGGIRGVIAIEVLAAIESHLREREANPNLVLADYFDYIGGTSTGAIIATCLSIGMSVNDVRTFYHTEGERMFTHASILRRFRYAYDAEPLARRLKQVLGGATLGDAALKTYLMLVLRNATTDSPWPVSNNPAATYNSRDRSDCNLQLPLWQLIRASAAAPTYFAPELIRLDEKTEFAFVDGGVTTYNNPAFLLFLMATLAPYKLQWPTGEERMLLVSIGTGRDPVLRPNLSAHGETYLGHAMTLPFALMSSAAMQQDLLCRSFGRCRCGLPLDGELGDLVDVAGVGTESNDGPGLRKLFAYARYDADLTRQGMQDLQVDIDADRIRRLDGVDAVSDLAQVGRAIAKRSFHSDHLKDFPLRSSTVGPNATQ